MRRKILVLAMLITVSPALGGCAVGNAALDTLDFAGALAAAPFCVPVAGKFDCFN